MPGMAGRPGTPGTPGNGIGATTTPPHLPRDRREPVHLDLLLVLRLSLQRIVLQ